MPYFFWTGLGIYKRKKESEQESNHTRVHEKKSSFKKIKKRFKLFLFVGSTNHTKLLKVKLDDISPNLKISFFSVRERFFFNEFFFSWTLSCSSFFSFINSQSDHKINCTCLISMPMPYFFDNYRYAYHNITNGNSIYL